MPIRLDAKSLQQAVLAQLLIVELVLFAVLSGSFLKVGNFLTVLRNSADLGLIALAMTTVIVTGGIDLSVGSLMGLCAVMFGKLWRDAHVPWPIAALLAMVIGLVGGVINAGAIARLKIHPLIVTLATFSLYRGIAEGITGGADNFTHFPQSFLAVFGGQPARIPIQLPVLILAVAAFYLLLHRSTIGRALSTIGYSPDGARYAGINVERTVAIPYILSGLMASISALLYAARVDQVKADVGIDYELAAITAVVLGGTSIFGGRATIIGTVLGLFAIRLLENGLHMADPARLGFSTHQLAPQLAGIATSALLLVAIGLDHRTRKVRSVARIVTQELDMKNSQIAVLCAVILAAALIVVGGNFVLINGITKNSAGQTVHVAIDGTAAAARVTDDGSAKSAAPGASALARVAHPITIGMMPKSVGNPYFIACKKGAVEAADALGDTLLWDGPTGSDPGKQNEIVETWINRGVDVIAVSADNAAGISTALREARARGIKVLTWDADAEPDARDFTIVQATPEGIGSALMDNAAKVMDGKGSFAIITASLTAANQNEWMKFIEKQRAAKYPDIQMKVVRPCDDQKDKAYSEANAILNSFPDVKLILAISSAAVPGAAEAVKQSGRTDVHVVGLGLPNENKPYVKAGITPAVILWNTMDLGYLTVVASQALKDGTLKPGATSLDSGKLGKLKVDGSNVMLGMPFVFNKDNIDGFDF
jgi:rhamnose transport system substrate-binding protein